MASAYIRNRYNNKNTRKTPFKSFTGSKPYLNKMHIFYTTYFCKVQNRTKLVPRCEKGIFSAMINKVQFTGFIFWKQRLLEELGV